MRSRLPYLTVVLCLFLGGALGARASTHWFLDADGVWQTSTNWNPATVPNVANGTDLLGAIVSADRTIRVEADAKMGQLTSASDYQRLNDTASIVLGNETFATGVFSEPVGALTQLSDATLDSGSGGESALASRNSADKSGAFTLTINDYFDDTELINFRTTGSGVSKAQLNQVRWADPYESSPGTALGAKKPKPPKPVPEPKTVISVLLLASILGWRERKTIVKGLSAVKRRLV